jgi:ribose transport system substrate-binding protein
MNRRNLPRTPWVALFLALAVAAVVAGCGGGSGGTSGSTAASTGGSGGNFDQAAWEKKVKQFEVGATKYEGPTEPVEISPDVNFAWISCSATLTGCTEDVEKSGEIAERLGWTVKGYDGKGTPQGQNTALEQAIAGGAELVLTGAIDPHFISSGLKAAREKNVIVGSVGQGQEPETDGYPFDVNGSDEQLGEMLGAYVVANSEGQAVYLPFADKSYESVIAVSESIEDTVGECEGCEVLPTEYFVATQLETTVPSRLLSLLRQNPDIGYVSTGYDPAAAALLPVVKNSGLSEQVQLIAPAGAEQNLQYVKEGNVQTADAAFDPTYAGYMGIYQLARLKNGEPLYKTPGATTLQTLYSGNVPVKLFTSDNPNFPVGSYNANSEIDYETKFDELFGIK